MAKARRRFSTEYCVMEGRASWHQARAGHSAAGSTCGFWRKKDAQKYVRSFKRHHPDEPAFIVTRKAIRRFGGK